MTIFSLVVMVLLILPFLSDATRTTLQFIDTLICVIFLLDFLGNLRRARVKRRYFLHEGGWLDLLGSIPSIPAFPWTAILRLARLGRRARILRFLRNSSKEELWAEFKANRAESALYVTAFVAIVVISVSAIVILQVESQADNPNITTGGDAFWWAFVTITTVGYGDRYPTTGWGRFFALILMVVGVGIFGVLTSYLSSAFIGPDDDEDADGIAEADIHAELQFLRRENAEIKASLADIADMVQKIE